MEALYLGVFFSNCFMYLWLAFSVIGCMHFTSLGSGISVCINVLHSVPNGLHYRRDIRISREYMQVFLVRCRYEQA